MAWRTIGIKINMLYVRIAYTHFPKYRVHAGPICVGLVVQVVGDCAEAFRLQFSFFVFCVKYPYVNCYLLFECPKMCRLNFFTMFIYVVFWKIDSENDSRFIFFFNSLILEDWLMLLYICLLSSVMSHGHWILHRSETLIIIFFFTVFIMVFDFPFMILSSFTVCLWWYLIFKSDS